MKITILSHNLSSNSAMRAHRLAKAAGTFAEVSLIGPMERRGLWPALPPEPWIRPVRKRRFPEFWASFVELVDAAEGDVLIAAKPELASYGVALVAAERREVPVILDLDDLDVALAPRSAWAADPAMADLSRPGSPVYVSLLTRVTGLASAITVVSTALQRRFGGTLIPHGADMELFDPAGIDRASVRQTFGFSGPTVLFPGIPRAHKGIELLAQAVSRVPDARLVVPCRPKDIVGPEWARYPLDRIPMVPYASLPQLLAAADVVAIPQSDAEPARYQVPMKVFDAMAMAKPVVASAVSDLPSILDGCGRLVPADDVGQLAAAISDLISDPHAARALGERARARCLERYSMQRVGETLGELVRQVARVSA
jgi:glycosyltransferase involved in cell wall biosynthesis